MTEKKKKSDSEKRRSSNRSKKSQSDSQEKAPVSKKRRVLKGLALAAVVLIVAPLMAFMVAYVMADVPQPGELETQQVTEIYASDGTTQLARIVPPEGNRQEVNLADIPRATQLAVLAAEDREFYSNSGFSFTGFGRAVLGQLTGNSSAGGGSTITQQYVKKALVGDEHSYTRKAKELVYSVKMTNEWSKDEILQAYLNTIYFGRNAYGIEAAAQAYFGIPASDLNLAQSAVLAAAIQRPSQLDPWQNRTEAEQRWNYVLDGMVSAGWLTPEDRAKVTYPETIDPSLNQPYTEVEGTNGHIKNQVYAELEKMGISEDDITTQGLRITTTIDPKTQESTIDAVKNNLDGQPDNLRMAAVSVEPATGAVRGYYGGDNPVGYDYANAPLQTGSTFKIFGLAAALQQGIPTSAYVSSANYSLPDGSVVTNDGVGCGECSVAESLKNSFNTSFLRLQDMLANKSQDTADMAHALGIAESLPEVPQTLHEDGARPYEGIILGQYQSRPLDMAHAVSTISNYGVYHDAYFVEKVTTADGKVLHQHQGKEQRRASEKVTTNVLSAMEPIAGWTGNNTLAGGRQSAAKTGTTQLGDTGQNKDAWMVGGTPQLSTAVWVGTDDGSPLLTASGASMYGSSVPGSTWKDILDGALEGEEYETFKSAEPLGYDSSATFTTGPIEVAQPTNDTSYETSETSSSEATTSTQPGGTDNPGTGGNPIIPLPPGLLPQPNPQPAPQMPAEPAEPAVPEEPVPDPEGILGFG